jgi:hypothetical protein
MSVQPPKIDSRSYDEIVAQTEALAQKFTDWQPRADGKPDAGRALIRIFSRMAATVRDRLNQIPEKSFLAFLDLIGTEIAPPQPARAPLTFSLAESSPEDAFVPAGTQVAAPAADEQQAEVVFELESELVVARSQLQAVFVRQPQSDRYSDNTNAALGVTDQDYPAFVATQPIQHHLYLACDELFTLPGKKTATLTLRSAMASTLQKLPITWAYWDAEAIAWKTLSGIVTGLTLTLDTHLLQIKVAPGNGITPDGAELLLAVEQVIDLANVDGQNYTGETILVLLGQQNSQTTIVIREVTTSESLTNCVCLAVLEVGAGNAGTLSHGVPSASGAVTEWTVTFKQLAALKPHTINDQTAGWIRACLEMPLLSNANLPTLASVIAKIDIKPADATQKQNLVPDACVFNTAPLDIEKDFFPFGEQPRFNDTFYLASREAFVANQEVTITVKLRQPGKAGTDDLEIDWEYWNGAKWQLLGSSNQFNDESAAFTQKDKNISFTVPADIAPKSINGEENYWVRTRIVRGNYGEAATSQKIGETPITIKAQKAGEPDVVSTIPIYGLSAATFSPPIIESLNLSYTLTQTRAVSACLTYNDFTYASQVTTGSEAVKTGAKTLRVADATLFQKGDRIVINPVGSSTQETGQIEQVSGTDAVITVTAPLTQDHLKGISLFREFQPFKPTSDQNPALYLGFDRAFPNRPITFYAQVQPLQPGTLSERTTRIKAAAASNQAKLQVEQIGGFRVEQAIRIAPGSGLQEDREIIAIQPERGSDQAGEFTLKQPLSHDQAQGTRIEQISSPPRLVWEYCSADQPQIWKSLVASDETSGLTERGLIRFIGPTDFVPCQVFGRRLYWLRLRWMEGDFLVQPRLRQMLINTTWATQSVKLENEGLGSSTGNPDQVFLTNQYPVLPGQRLEVREDLSPSEQKALEDRDRYALTLVHNEVGELEAIWVCWQEVTDFYGSTRDDRHYVLNHLTGEVRFGDGQRGRVPPVGRQNIRLAQYHTGGGNQGNKPANTITQLKTTIPYIDRVTNVEAAMGAANQESLERVKERGPKQLRHRDRAVTAQDMEDLAFEASAEVVRARAIPPRFSDELEWLPTYHIPIVRPGTIDIEQFTWTEQTDLQVAFYAPEQATPKAQQVFAKNQQKLTYTITADMLASGSAQVPTFPLAQPLIWRVTLLNPNANDVSNGFGTIVYPTGTPDAPTSASKAIEFSRLTSRPHREVVEAGQLELVIVPRSIAKQPTPNLALLERVETYITARCTPTLAFRVTEPTWVEVTITATIATLSFEGADATRNRALHTLTQFLHPLSGSATGRGWEFGRRPQESDIYAVLEAVEGVDYVKTIDPISLQPQITETTSPYFLIYSGTHTIRIE